jgi:hypothetical protein
VPRQWRKSAGRTVHYGCFSDSSFARFSFIAFGAAINETTPASLCRNIFWQRVGKERLAISSQKRKSPTRFGFAGQAK